MPPKKLIKNNDRIKKKSLQNSDLMLISTISKDNPEKLRPKTQAKQKRFNSNFFKLTKAIDLINGSKFGANNKSYDMRDQLSKSVITTGATLNKKTLVFKHHGDKETDKQKQHIKLSKADSIYDKGDSQGNSPDASMKLKNIYPFL